MKLSKSLSELDAVADELLAKSKSKEDDDELTPNDVSEDSTPDKEDADNADSSEEKDNEPDETDEGSEDKKPMKKSEDKKPMKKSEDPEPADDEDDEPDETDESDEDNEPDSDEIEKSIKEDFTSDETINKSIQDSEFYSAIVDILAKSLGSVQFDVLSNSKSQSAASDILAKSIQAVIQANKSLQSENEKLTRRINKLEKSISQGFERVMDSLDEISSQPAHMRKSLASISVHNRDFDTSLNGQKTVGKFDSLSKSQVLDILNAELFSGNQNVTPQDIIGYESGAPLKQNLKTLVESKCK